jgi:hypothetical protein
MILAYFRNIRSRAQKPAREDSKSFCADDIVLAVEKIDVACFAGQDDAPKEPFGQYSRASVP